MFYSQLWMQWMVFALSYYVLIFHVSLLSGRSLSLLRRDRKGVDLEGKWGREQLREEKIGETIIKIYLWKPIKGKDKERAFYNVT